MFNPTSNGKGSKVLIPRSSESIAEEFNNSLMHTAILGKERGSVTVGQEPSDTSKTLNDILIGFKERFSHTLVLGPTGSGKTSSMLIPMVNQDAQNPDCNIIVVDPRGEFALKSHLLSMHYGKDSVYVDPSMSNCPKFDLFSYDEEDVIALIMSIYQKYSQNSSTQFFDTEKKLLTRSIQVLKRLDSYHGVYGEYANFANMHSLFQNSGNHGRELIAKFLAIPTFDEYEQTENDEIASWFLNEYFSEHSKDYQDSSAARSFLSSIVSNSFIRKVLTPDVHKGEEGISFDALFAEGNKALCISLAQGKLGNKASQLFSLIITQCLISCINHRLKASNAPIFVYIDEVPFVFGGDMPDLATWRLHNVAGIFAAQSVAQFEDKTFLYPIGNKIISADSDKETIDLVLDPAEGFSFLDSFSRLAFGLKTDRFCYRLVDNFEICPLKMGFGNYIPKDLDDEINKDMMRFMLNDGKLESNEVQSRNIPKEKKLFSLDPTISAIIEDIASLTGLSMSAVVEDSITKRYLPSDEHPMALVRRIYETDDIKYSILPIIRGTFFPWKGESDKKYILDTNNESVLAGIKKLFTFIADSDLILSSAGTIAPADMDSIKIIYNNLKSCEFKPMTGNVRASLIQIIKELYTEENIMEYKETKNTYDQFDILKMRVNGATVREIAGKLNVSEAEATKLLKKAFTNLRELIEEQDLEV